MPFIDSNHQRAALLLLLLGLGLVITLSPYATGLIGIPVLYVVLAPAHGWLTRHVHARLAASLVVVLALFLIAVPGVSFAGLVVNQAQQIAGGVIQSPLLGRLAELKVGTIDVGSQLADLGAKIVSFIGSSAFGLIGTATRLALNLTISLFGLFFLLLSPGETWSAVQPYIPFSAKNTEKLRARFRVVTMVFAILPVVGSGLVWGPGAIALALDHRYGAAIGLALWGLILVGNVDYVIRPLVFRRWAHIHPLITVLGALAGVPYFGILGLLIGPLALSYFFELIKMYREEYLKA